MLRKRYQDIIDTSDMIDGLVGMLKKFNSKLSHLESISTQYTSLDRTLDSKSLNREHEDTRIITDLVRTVVDVADDLWELLEDHEFIQALNLYKTTKSKYEHIDIKRIEDTFGRFDYLKTSWEKIETFDSVVEYECLYLLAQEGFSNEVYSNALCTVLNIRNISEADCFDLFIKQRLLSFQHIVSKRFNFQDICTSLLRLFEHFQVTFYHILTIFLGDGEEEPLLWTKSCMINDSQKLHLDIREHVKSKTKEWIASCGEVLPYDIFNGISDVTLLPDFKRNVYNMLQSSLPNTDMLWKDCCLLVLEEQINPWNILFHRRFVNGVRHLTSQLFDSIQFEKKISICIESFTSGHYIDFNDDLDIGQYIWSPIDIEGIDPSVSKLKANGTTTKMKKLVESFELGLEDISQKFYRLLDNKKVFYETNEELDAYYKETYNSYLNSISEDILQRIEYLSKAERDPFTLNIILFLGRLSHALHRGSITYLKAYEIWIERYKATYSSKLSHYLTSWSNIQQNSIGRIRSRWKEVEISSEQGGYESVPVNPSPEILALILETVNEVSKAGSFTIDPSIIEFLTFQLAELTYNLISKCLNEILNGQSQKEILIQLWFDSKFILTVLPKKVLSEYYQHIVLKSRGIDNLENYDDVDETIEWIKKVDALFNTIKDNIDPIEVAFYTPHINQHVKQSLERYASILGPLSPV